MSLKFELLLNAQEEGAVPTADFKTVQVLQPTHGFNESFNEEATEIMQESLKMIVARYDSEGAYYMQVFEYNGIKFWAIREKTALGVTITFLLPSEY